MFAEIFEWLTTPCTPEARRLGYLREAIAIRARYRRHQSRWQPHLDATKAIIREAAEQAKNKQAVVVLGSGALYDVPLEDLARQFSRVELIDIVHPKKSRQIAAAYSNVTCRTADISGAARSLLHLPRDGTEPPQLDPPPHLPDDTGLVISVNLLSQLPEIPQSRLIARTTVADAERHAFAAAIVRQHLHWLSQAEFPVCLIADTERHYVDPNGEPMTSWDSLYGETLPAGGRTWTWDVAPKGEIHPDLGVEMTVRGIPDFDESAVDIGAN